MAGMTESFADAIDLGLIASSTAMVSQIGEQGNEIDL
jgi:hypothetical protein